METKTSFIDLDFSKVRVTPMKNKKFTFCFLSANGDELKKKSYECYDLQEAEKLAERIFAGLCDDTTEIKIVENRPYSEENINFKLQYKTVSIWVSWYFEDENDNDGVMKFVHPLTGTKYPDISHVLAGWHDKDPAVQRQWNRLVDYGRIFCDQSELYWQIDNNVLVDLSNVDLPNN